ncbi:MAG: DUF3795 domain-containing protein, partial [Bacillota bacterium]
MLVSPCGVDCSGCKSYPETCLGCREIEGKVFWAAYIGADTCPMYHCCANERQLKHCGECEELPCHIYFDTQDPEMTKEEHEEGIRQRVEILKG